MPKEGPQTDMLEVQRPTHEASDHWKQKVLGDADSLFRDLDALFFDSWARPGVDLQPEIASICDKWKQKQLSSEEVQSPQMDIWLQSLLDELQKVVQSEAGTADGRPQTDMPETHQVSRKSAEKKGGMMPKKSPQTNVVEVEQPKDTSNHWKQKVGCGAESLFQDLDSLFSDSWARPGVDLKPEMAQICEAWRRAQLRQLGDSASPWIQLLLDDIQKVPCNHGQLDMGQVRQLLEMAGNTVEAFQRKLRKQQLGHLLHLDSHQNRPITDLPRRPPGKGLPCCE
eukprot:g19296.t1